MSNNNQESIATDGNKVKDDYVKIKNELEINLNNINEITSTVILVDILNKFNDFLNSEIFPFLTEYFNSEKNHVGVNTLINQLELLNSYLKHKYRTKQHESLIVSLINETKINFETLKIIYENYLETDKLISELKSKVEIATNATNNITAAKNALDGNLTENIYTNASVKYLGYARLYDFFSYISLIAILTIGIYIFSFYPKNNTDILNFFLSKILIISTLITLTTIFLRKATHLRKLHDQANQTSLELQALPLFLRNVDEAEHSEIYKNLSTKYFGKELDQSQNDKVGDLVKDQLAAGTELIKASAEMVKNTKSLGDSAGKTKNAKSHSTSTDDKSKPNNEA